MSFIDIKKYDYHYFSLYTKSYSSSKDTFINHQRLILLDPQKVLYIKDTSINDLDILNFNYLKRDIKKPKIKIMILCDNKNINLDFDYSENVVPIIDTFYREIILIKNINKKEVEIK